MQLVLGCSLLEAYLKEIIVTSMISYQTLTTALFSWNDTGMEEKWEMG